ncbi:MAG: L-threonylcarbamoyladenylate synthase [Spirulinaceae cyanobacterium]
MPLAPTATLVTAFRRGEVLSFPTDTVPALAVQPDQAATLFQLKHRSPAKPLILLGASWAQLQPYVEGSKADLSRWRSLADQHWPGALTLVLPASCRVPLAMHPQDPQTIGLRVPQQPLALALLQQTGPLATSSANHSGESPLLTPAAIAAAFPSVWALSHPSFQPEQALGSAQPSTVLRWQAPDWQILRSGSVTIAATP